MKKSKRQRDKEFKEHLHYSIEFSYKFFLFLLFFGCPIYSALEKLIPNWAWIIGPVTLGLLVFLTKIHIYMHEGRDV